MNWLVLAFVAPFLWAVVFVIDTYLIDGVYEDEFDGAIVVGIFQTVPWLFVLAGVIPFLPLDGVPTALAVLAGALLLFSFFFYFKALFVLNDATLMQILWNFSVPLVPFLSWVIAGEALLPIHYIGIGTAFLGITIFSLEKKKPTHKFSKILVTMSLAVLFMSLSMVVSKRAYELSPSFWSTFLLFSLGMTMAAGLLVFIDRKKISERVIRIIRINRGYFLVFLLSEGLSTVGVLTSQGAISLTPSVSFVAVIESLVPMFGMVVSFILILFLKTKKQDSIRQIYQQQFVGLWKKVFAMILITIGIALIA